MPRRYVDTEESRRVILGRFRELLVETPFEKLRIVDVARACAMSAPNVHRIFPTKHDLHEAAISDSLMTPLPGPVGCGESSPDQAVRFFIARKHATLLGIAEREPNLFALTRHAFYRDWFVAESYYADIEEGLARILAVIRGTDEPAVTPCGLDVALLLARALRPYVDPLAVATTDPASAEREIGAITLAMLAADATGGAVAPIARRGPKDG